MNEKQNTQYFIYLIKDFVCMYSNILLEYDWGLKASSEIQ